MARFIKHVGQDGKGAPVVVVFREVPNDSEEQQTYQNYIKQILLKQLKVYKDKMLMTLATFYIDKSLMMAQTCYQQFMLKDG